MSDETAPFGSTAELLALVDQAKAAEIVAAFGRAAVGAPTGTVMWALAMLQADMLARADPELGLWVAARLADLCQVALPAMIAARRPDEVVPHKLHS